MGIPLPFSFHLLIIFCSFTADTYNIIQLILEVQLECLVKLLVSEICRHQMSRGFKLVTNIFQNAMNFLLKFC